jgi:gliding motility-associated-like protein
MKLITYLLLFITFQGFSQYCPYLGPDQLLPCGVGSTTLTADLTQCGVGGSNPNQTTNYGVTNIPYVNQTNTGTSLFMSDDTQQGPFNIGFNFCFFGTTYTQFYVGSNGWISFSGGQPTTFTSQSIPTGNGLVPKNCIMGPWQDWNPGIGGQIRYQVQGTAPCRKLVVSWIGVPMFSCTSNQGTFHIVIYESSNVIENHIQSKPPCLQWQGGTSVQGIHNLGGTIGITSPGRNSTAWTANNDAYRWTPSGPVVTPTLTWYQVGNPIPIGTGPTINVTPPAGGANYTCQFVYPICNAGWSSCNVGIGNLGPDTVFVLPGPPNLPSPIVNVVNPTCDNNCDGIIDIIPQGGTGVQTISWNGTQPPIFNQIGLCEGSYSFTITDGAGCTVTSSATLTDPQPIVIDPIIGVNILCFNSTTNPFTVSNPTPNLNYVWVTTNGGITSGQGTNQINLDVTGVAGGNYNGMLSVYGQNINGCVSQTETFNVNILNILPVINPMGPYCEYDGCTTIIPTPAGGTLFGNNIWGNQYCPDNGFVGLDNVSYVYNQSGCVFSTNIDVQVYSRPLITPVIDGNVDLNNEYHELCEGDSIVDTYEGISPNGGYNEWYVFGDTLQGPTINITWDTEGVFNFEVVRWENGCSSLPQDFNVTIELCPETIYYIPNSFTPDGDEHNNTFKWIFTSGFDPTDFNIVIYNRWGELIFESNNHMSYWDGTYGNKICPIGMYTYKVRFGDPKTDGKYMITGNVNLIR